MVVARDPVHLQGLALSAPVDDRPLAPGPDLDRDRLHRAAAGALPVPGFLVEVARPQAARAVVPVPRPEPHQRDLVTADDARERRAV